MNDERASRAGPREWIGLMVLSLPTLLLALDFTMSIWLFRIWSDLKPSSAQPMDS